MKKWKITKGTCLSLMGVSVVVAAAGGWYWVHQAELSKNKKASLISSHSMATFYSLIQPNLQLFTQALADEEPGNAECNSKGKTAWGSCFTKDSAYKHGALNFFNGTLCALNKGFPAQVETSLCHFKKSLGLNPDKGALPITISKTFGPRTVELVIEKPTEAFAIAAGYDAKGTVTVNGTKFMVLYWGGTEESTKGFMISGATGMGGPSTKHPSYIYWDRTNPEAQFVKVFVANYTTSYLTSFGAMSKDSPQGGDRAMYGEATYNSTTKAVTVQTVSIEGQRGVGTSAGCFKMFATGTKGGTISVGKTKNAFGLTGHATTDVNKNGLDMDAAVLVDVTETANGTGNFNTTTEAGLTVIFKKSCNEVYTAGATGNAFAGGDVNFAAVPSDLF